MGFDSAAAFELLRRSNEEGLLDELVAVFDGALDEVLEETGLDMGDLLGLLDSAPGEVVLAAEEKASALEPGKLASLLVEGLEGPERREATAARLARGLRLAVATAQAARAAGVEGV